MYYSVYLTFVSSLFRPVGDPTGTIFKDFLFSWGIKRRPKQALAAICVQAN